MDKKNADYMSNWSGNNKFIDVLIDVLRANIMAGNEAMTLSDDEALQDVSRYQEWVYALYQLRVVWATQFTNAEYADIVKDFESLEEKYFTNGGIDSAKVGNPEDRFTIHKDLITFTEKVLRYGHSNGITLSVTTPEKKRDLRQQLDDENQ